MPPVPDAVAPRRPQASPRPGRRGRARRRSAAPGRCAGRRRRGRRRRRAGRSASARATCATSAASRSLSPNRISSVATVSFSLTTGSDAQREQPVQGALGVAVVAAADQVVGGQQHLADVHAVPGEGVGVALRRAGPGRRWPPPAGWPGRAAGGQPERRQAGGDRPGGDQHDLAAVGADGGQGVDQRVEPVRRRARRARWSARTSRP